MRPRIARRKAKPKEENEEVSDEPIENLENQKPSARPAHFKVVCETVNIYTTPSTRSSTIGAVSSGKTLFGLPYSLSGNPWLKIDETECNELFPNCSSDGWVLIHGSCMGQGQLLKTLPAEEEQQLLESRFGANASAMISSRFPVSAEEAARAPERDETTGAFFEVVHGKALILRPEPSFNAPTLGSIASGKITSGAVRILGGTRWLCIEGAECRKQGLSAERGWALVGGADGSMLRMLTAEEERTYVRAQSELDKEREKMEEAKREAEKQRLALEQEKAALEEQRRAMEAAAAQAAAAQAAAAQAAAAQAALAQAAAAQAAAAQAAAGPAFDAANPAPVAAPVTPAPSPVTERPTGPDPALPEVAAAQPQVQPIESATASEDVVAEAQAAAAPAVEVAAAPSPAKQKVPRPPGEVKDWTVDDVIQYLESLELGKYTDAFRDNSVDGEFLLELSEADLMSECNIPKLSAKKVKMKLTKP